MSRRRLHIDDKHRLYMSHKGMWAGFSMKVLALFKVGEELSIHDIADRSKRINGGHSFKTSAVNKALTGELKDKVVPCGKNKWKLKN